jgi:hypothetical protein
VLIIVGTIYKDKYTGEYLSEKTTSFVLTYGEFVADRDTKYKLEFVHRTPTGIRKPKTSEFQAGASSTDNSHLRIPVVGNRKIDVYSMAQLLVKKALKSPSTASFPWSADEYEVYDLGNSRYSVSSWVDSENSFGATIRTYFNIVMKNVGDSWRTESIHTN